MNRRVLSLVLAIALMSLLAACGGSGSKEIPEGTFNPVGNNWLNWEYVSFHDDGKVAFMQITKLPGGDEMVTTYDFDYTLKKDALTLTNGSYYTVISMVVSEPIETEDREYFIEIIDDNTLHITVEQNKGINYVEFVKQQ